jgi:hypothetical protein
MLRSGTATPTDLDRRTSTATGADTFAKSTGSTISRRTPRSPLSGAGGGAVSEHDDDARRTGLGSGDEGAEEMGGATGITGGGESGGPGEGVKTTDRSPGRADPGGPPSDPAGGSPAVGGSSPTPEEDTD